MLERERERERLNSPIFLTEFHPFKPWFNKTHVHICNEPEHLAVSSSLVGILNLYFHFTIWHGIVILWVGFSRPTIPAKHFEKAFQEFLGPLFPCIENIPCFFFFFLLDIFGKYIFKNKCLIWSFLKLHSFWSVC